MPLQPKNLLQQELMNRLKQPLKIFIVNPIRSNAQNYN